MYRIRDSTDKVGEPTTPSCYRCCFPARHRFLDHLAAVGTAAREQRLFLERVGELAAHVPLECFDQGQRFRQSQLDAE